MDVQPSPVPDGPLPPLDSRFPATEVEFYGQYPWCLNPFPTVQQVIGYLRHEVKQLDSVQLEWQLREVMTNIFLLSCAVSDSGDDHLTGKRYDFSSARKKVPVVGSLFAVPERILNARQKLADRGPEKLRGWREAWELGLHQLLRTCAIRGPVDMSSYKAAAGNLIGLLEAEFPPDFLARRTKCPRAFRSQDFTFEDILRLAERFCAQFTNPLRPLLVIGLRTAGSYFAPVLRAFLANQGFSDTGILTLRPKGGATTSEMAMLGQYAQRGGLAVIIDEPVYQGVTLGKCMALLHKGGFSAEATVALFPVHTAARDWHHTDAAVALNRCSVITLQPEETYRYGCFENSNVEQTLRAYFAERGWTSATVIEDARARALNAALEENSDRSFSTRLKRVYAVRLEKDSGSSQIRYVIAKSVGLGWKGYQAFFAANRLARFLPPVLGLRDGILFSEWVGRGQPELATTDRPKLIDSVARYIAARAEALRFPGDPSPELCRAGLQLGMDVLVEKISRLSGSSIIANLNKPAIRQALSLLTSPTASLIDGKNRVCEWVQTDTGVLKTDFEQHGMGRIDLSFTDPAYDLAEVVLSFGLTAQEETALLDRYAALTGDPGVVRRLPLYKLMAGDVAMELSLYNLGEGKLTARHPEFNRGYIDAWTYSMVQMARFCATFLPKPAPRNTTGPIVFADVDGVIDRHAFNFPTTTPSGIRALGLLISHGIPVYLDTARSCYDVREYCLAYGLAGGVAESGSYVWDADTGRERVLVEPESLHEIEKVRAALERVPGVFTNHFYRYSIKAHTYVSGGTVPLPTPLINRVLAEVGAKTLMVHHTASDTAITSRAVDKGTGLLALLKLIEREDAQSIAIGDTAPDLAMFRVARRSYAPAHTPVRGLATLLGCRVVSGAYQAGFLQIARDIVHPDGATCQACVDPQFITDAHGQLLIDRLGEVDKSKARRMLSALLDSRSLKAFLK